MFTPEDIKGVANEARETVKRSLISSVCVSLDDSGICCPFSVSMFINPYLAVCKSEGVDNTARIFCMCSISVSFIVISVFVSGEY